MKGQELIAALKRKLGITTDIALKNALGLSGMTLQNWKGRKITPRIVADQIARVLVSGNEVVAALHRHLRTSSLIELSKKVGVTQQAVRNWDEAPLLTARRIAGMVKAAVEATSTDTYRSAVRPLVEFFPLAKCPSRQGAKYELFSSKSAKGKPHLYLDGLKSELSKHHGVYVFFDSRGQAIYAGKARKLPLWSEITNAFNRHRGSVQKIRRVKHPSRNQAYQTTNEKSRQISEFQVPIHDLAAYFSAYAVADPLIDDVESLLLRSFANDVLNKRMERFDLHRATAKPKRRRRKKPTRARRRNHRKKH